MSFTSHVKPFMEELKVKSFQGLQAAGLHLMNKQKQTLSKSARTGKSKSDVEPSSPGEPPRLRTGTLRQSVTMQQDKPNMLVRVGVPRATIYGFWLEVGTSHIRPRPWMIATLKEEMGIITRLAASEW